MRNFGCSFLKRIEKHRLVDPTVLHCETPNRGNPFAPDLPDTIVIHYTDLPSAEEAVNRLCDPAAQVSAHLVIGRDATVWQLLPFNIVGWHAGISQHTGRDGLNKYALGIEMDNAGRLQQDKDQFISWCKRLYPRDEVVCAVHPNETGLSYWHRYPDLQICKLEMICRILANYYPIRWLVGHDEIAPERKCDPGPAFPMLELRRKVFAGLCP